MPLEFSPRDPERSARILQGVIAAIHLALVIMLLYMRFVSMDRVLARFTERGIEIPAWLSLGLTAGILGMALFLAIRGFLAFRKALGPRS